MQQSVGNALVMAPLRQCPERVDECYAGRLGREVGVMGTIRGRVPRRRSTLCASCALPMLRIGFDVKDHGKTVFHYKCQKCGQTRMKTLKSDG